jgi:AcrR family transcriptional regulator
MTPPRVRAERREVAVNRERILVAAERVFSAEGLDAPLHRVAEEAGLGIATLFRRFPRRDDLDRALYDIGAARIQGIIDRALAEHDTGWPRVEAFMREIMALIFEMPILPGLMRRVATYDPTHRPGDAWRKPIGDTVLLARQEGTLRSDVNGYDLVTLAFMFNGIAYQPEPMRSMFGERMLTIVLDGLRAGSTTPMPALGRLDKDEFHLGSHGV